MCAHVHTCAWVGANQVEGEEENEEINTIDVSAQVCISSAHPQLSLIFSVQKSDFFTSFQRSSDSNQVVELEQDTGYNKQQRHLKWNRSRETRSSGNSLEVEEIVFSSLSERSVSFIDLSLAGCVALA